MGKGRAQSKDQLRKRFAPLKLSKLANELNNNWGQESDRASQLLSSSSIYTPVPASKFEAAMERESFRNTGMM
jgi:hypothetical protein